MKEMEEWIEESLRILEPEHLGDERHAYNIIELNQWTIWGK